VPLVWSGRRTASIPDAVESYLSVRQANEVVYGVQVDPGLGHAVEARLRENNIL